MSIRFFLCFAAILGLLLAATSGQAQQPPSASEIVEKLKGPAPSRSIEFVEPSATPQPAPRINLSVNFRLNSAELDQRGQAVVDVLGKALGSPDLKPFQFEIAGHTDASGSRAYNIRLSAARAESVRQALIAAGIEAARIVPKGYGPDRPVDPARPMGAVNRRVEVVNLGLVRQGS